MRRGGQLFFRQLFLKTSLRGGCPFGPVRVGSLLDWLGEVVLWGLFVGCLTYLIIMAGIVSGEGWASSADSFEWFNLNAPSRGELLVPTVFENEPAWWVPWCCMRGLCVRLPRGSGCVGSLRCLT